MPNYSDYVKSGFETMYNTDIILDIYQPEIITNTDNIHHGYERGLMAGYSIKLDDEGREISIETDFPLSPIDFEISTWINVSSQGQPVSGEDVFFRYEIGAYNREYHGGNTVAQYANLTTAANGSAFITFNTGHFPDDSESQDDVGSHGILAYIYDGTNSIFGATTVTIDSDIHAVDLVSRSEGVTVERTRGNRTVTLDSSIGFNAIPGDDLTFGIPVLNRGILPSPETTMLVENPDGTTSSTIITSLGCLQ